MKPCQHASYCPRRMRDGDRPGCADRAQKHGCEPVVARVVVLPRLDLDQPFCRRCGATVTPTAWRSTGRFVARCSCGCRDIAYPGDIENNQEK